MASLSMKTRPALLCGIFTLFLLEISESLPNSNKTAAQSPAEESSPHNATWPMVDDGKNQTMSTAGLNYTTFPPKSTERNRSASESVSGSESITHNNTLAGEKNTTVAIALTTILTPVLTPEQQTNPRTPANSTLATQPSALTTNFTPIKRNSTNTTSATTVFSTALPKMNPESATNVNITSNEGFNQSTATDVNATENAKNLSTTTKPAVFNATVVSNVTNVVPTNGTQGGMFPKISNTTTTYLINTTKTEAKTTLSAISTTTAALNLTNMTDLVPTNGTQGGIIQEISPATTPNVINSTEGQAKTTFSTISTTSAELPLTNMTDLVPTNSTLGGIAPEISHTTTANLTKSPKTTPKEATEPCSSIGIVKKCLIVIASLAVVCVIFIISTVVLCTKLSSRKYKLRRRQNGSEMMCISSLMPERSNRRPVRYTRQRSPVPNGVLVIHNSQDSDDEMGDNLTLSSFI